MNLDPYRPKPEDDPAPEYGTPPEPKYGRRAEPKPEPEWNEEQLAELRRALAEPRRSPYGMKLAAFFLVIAAVLGWGASQGAWWGLLWFPFSFFAFFGVFGLWYDSRKIPRDGNDRPLP